MLVKHMGGRQTVLTVTHFPACSLLLSVTDLQSVGRVNKAYLLPERLVTDTCQASTDGFGAF